MKLDVIKLDGKKAGSVDLGEDIFGLEPRADILHRVVRWQRNNAQAGTHKVKTRSEDLLLDQEDLSPKRHRWRTPRRLATAPIFRKGGGVYKGPVAAFSHGHDLPKKVPQARSEATRSVCQNGQSW